MSSFEKLKERIGKGDFPTYDELTTEEITWLMHEFQRHGHPHWKTTKNLTSLWLKHNRGVDTSKLKDW